MDKTRIYPADSFETAPALDDGNAREANVVQPELDQPTEQDPARQRAYAENEGLVEPASRNAQSIESGRGQSLDEKVHAEQRGRTA